MAIVNLKDLKYDASNPIYNASLKAFDKAYNPSTFAVADDAPFLKKLAAQLYGSEASKNRIGGDFARAMNDVTLADFAKHNISAVDSDVLNKFANSSVAKTAAPISEKFLKNAADSMANPLSLKKVDGVSNLVSTADLLGANIKAHPGAALGTAVNAAGNLAGLFDNNKLLGQIAGTVGGALLGPKVFGLGPFGGLNAAMIGGNLGALFDNLRAKRAEERAAAEAVQQTY